MEIRGLKPEDVPALQAAIDKDKFHPGEWSVEDFTFEPGKPAVDAQVIERSSGPIVFVRYTKVLRISCVWNDADDISANAKAVILGIRNAIEMARGSGFSEIIIMSEHDKLSKFLVEAIGMTKRGSEHLLLL